MHGGPGPTDYSAYELDGTAVVVRPLGVAPEHADVVYAHRPIGELPGIVAAATSMGAEALWYQSGLTRRGAKDPKGCWLADDDSRTARALVESAGLAYVADPYIADVIRKRTPRI